jgi:hypothetical protein
VEHRRWQQPRAERAADLCHYGDLTVARRRDESDDAAPLEKAEDAFARALDDGFDVRLGRCRRRVEHETLPVAIRRIYAIQEDCVNVWVTPEVTVGALDDGNRAVLAAGNAPIRQVLAIAGRYGVGEDAQDLAQQFPVEGQRKSQRERQREDKLSDGRLGQNVV